LLIIFKIRAFVAKDFSKLTHYLNIYIFTTNAIKGLHNNSQSFMLVKEIERKKKIVNSPLLTAQKIDLFKYSKIHGK